MDNLHIGSRVSFSYTHPVNFDRRTGSGVIVGDSEIIGTDYGYAIKRDGDGEVVHVRCFNVFPQ